MKISAEEKRRKQLDAANIELVNQEIRDHGYVILEDSFHQSWINKMSSVFVDQLQAGIESNDEAISLRAGHGGFQPDITLPFIDPLIVENPLVFQALQRVLGDHFFGVLPYGCNVSFPGSQAQTVHRDSGHIFPEVSQSLPPLILVVNIALSEFTTENGATEIWPGSHRYVDTDRAETNTLRIQQERWSTHRSIRMTMPPGSIVIRDMRTWHRGMPNATNELRIMLSLVYYRQYFLPDNLSAPAASVSDSDWEQLSDRAKWVYRLRR